MLFASSLSSRGPFAAVGRTQIGCDVDSGMRETVRDLREIGSTGKQKAYVIKIEIFQIKLTCKTVE